VIPPQPVGPGPRIYIPQLYPQAMGSIIVVSCDSQGYGGVIRITLDLLKTESESESKLLYDWWFTAHQFVLAPSPIKLTARIFFSIEHLR
jgi:hypothetical protein